MVHRLTHEELVLLLGGIEPARTQRKMHPTSFRDKQRYDGTRPVEDLINHDLLARVDAAYRTVAAFRCAPNSSAAEIIRGVRMLNRR